MIGDFKITFRLGTERRQIQTPVESQYNFNELKDGFWIDINHNLCRVDRGVYWIPPGRIEVIERLQ